MRNFRRGDRFQPLGMDGHRKSKISSLKESSTFNQGPMPAFDHRRRDSLDPRLWRSEISSSVRKNGCLYLREGGPYRDLAFHKILLIAVVGVCYTFFVLKLWRSV